MRNRAAVLYAPHDVRLEERPMPQVGPNDVLVEVKAVGVVAPMSIIMSMGGLVLMLFANRSYLVMSWQV